MLELHAPSCARSEKVGTDTMIRGSIEMKSSNAYFELGFV